MKMRNDFLKTPLRKIRNLFTVLFSLHFPYFYFNNSAMHGALDPPAIVKSSPAYRFRTPGYYSR
jgi:hypothetical protein